MKIKIALVAVSLLYVGALASQQASDGERLFTACRNNDLLDSNTQGAIQCFERVVREYSANRPLLARARLALGQLYEEIEDQAKARESYDELCKMTDQPRAGNGGCEALQRFPDPGRLKFVTPYTDDPYSFALSPDGKKLVYQARLDGKSQLWIVPVDSSSKPAPIPGTQNAKEARPFFSPDGKSLGFFAEQRLKRVDLATGAVKDLAPAPSAAGGSWSSAGVIVFSGRGPTNNLERVPAGGGKVEPVPHVGLQGTSTTPSFFPDGQHFLYVVQSGAASNVALGALDPDGLNPAIPPAARGAIVAPPDRILYIAGNRLLAQSIDPKTFRLSGGTTVVADRVGWQPSTPALVPVSASAAGPIAYRIDVTVERQMVWIDRNGRQTGTIGAPDSESPSRARVSPDGRYVAYQRATTTAFGSVWAMNTEDGQRTQLEPNAQFPVFSPSGDSVAVSRIRFNGERGGNGWGNLYIHPLSLLAGQGNWVRVADATDFPQDWSRQDYLLYRTTTEAGNLMAVPVRGGNPITVAATPAREGSGRFSPDGNWVAYVSDEAGGRDEVFLQPFPGSTASRRKVSVAGGTLPRWGRGGHELYFLSPENHVMVVSVTLPNDPGAPVIGVPRPLFSNALREGSEFEAASDGDRFLVITPVADSTPIHVIPGIPKAQSSVTPFR